MRWKASHKVLYHRRSSKREIRSLSHDISANRKDSERLFFETLFSHLRLSHLEDWYKVSRTELIENGGQWILANHDNSLVKSLSIAFPGIKS